MSIQATPIHSARAHCEDCTSLESHNNSLTSMLQMKELAPQRSKLSMIKLLVHGRAGISATR